jgi:hypothetical protein
VLEEVLEPARALALRPRHPALEQLAERHPGVPVEEQVVGHLVDDVVGVRVGEVLRPVPA